MRDQIQRMVKSTDCRNRTNRLDTCVGTIAFGRPRKSHRYFGAGRVTQGLCRTLYRSRRPVCFDQSIRVGLTTFQGNLLCKCFCTFPDEGRSFLKDFNALRLGQRTLLPQLHTLF